MRVRSLTMSLALLTLATEARADFPSTGSFLEHCSSGSIRTCSSFQVTTAARSGGGRSVWMFVRNLQGTLGLDNTGGSLITRLGLTHPGLQGVGDLSVSTSGSAREVKNASERWKILNDGDGGGGSIGGQVTFSTGTTGVEGGILGCDPSGASPQSYFQTCGDRETAGDEGWVVFSFTTTNEWDAAASEVAWKVQAVTADGESYVCRTDGDCVAVTPEPVTMVLLGSGLLGLGYVRRRRGPRGEIDRQLPPAGGV